MKISEKQLIMLMDIAKDSLRIKGIFGGYEPHVRLELVNDIINQQSNELKEVDILNKNVIVPEYDELTEGFDPSKLKKKT